MKRKWVVFMLTVAFLTLQFTATSQTQRFPKPEFESGYTQPQTVNPDARAEIFSLIDVIVLFTALSIITWLILKKRSRRGVFWMSLFAIAYFGFFREGCVCSIGAVQNITLALFNTGYQIPLSVIAFFTLPLIFALFFGRTFCAGVCPLGAIQDIVIFKPMKVKPWIQKFLGLIPFIYLGMAVLYAATSTDFIICRYDPFIGFFRMDGTFEMLIIGGILLLLGIFIARPYCRFLCPYSVLLNWSSRLSKKHLSITPSNCIQCKLCEDSCPFDAIDKPVSAKEIEKTPVTKKRIILLTILIPVLMIIGGWTASLFHGNLARVNPKVQLAQNIINLDESKPPTDEITAFKSSGQSREQLFTEAKTIINDFYTGSWILGAFIGLIFGVTLWNSSIYRYREDYTPNKGTCLSCARCVDYCPVKPKNDQ